ncbi:MAG: UbiD family decarboxylase, partial [Romboutsia sp.]|nr:UbiD family decarboxylase [Romboutsia sp.]
MYLKEVFSKFTDFIDNNRANITKLLLSILATIALIIVLIISSDEISVSKEINNLVQNIESRKYQIAYDYYEDLKESFSESKMKRLNKSLSKKINSLIISNGDKYVNKQITKEQFAGLINTINGFDEININLENIIQQAKRVDEMYLDESIDYDVALTYFSVVSTLNDITDELDKYKQNIKSIHDSREVYEDASKNQQNKKYYEAILGYDKVLSEDEKYYKLAKLSKEECINAMYSYYIQQAKDANENGDYDR